MSVFIIAEAGVNHNGSIEVAKKLIDEAKLAGADCIKFQTFKTENIVSHLAETAEYQRKNTGKIQSQYEMLKKLELTFDEFKELKKYCEYREIQFMSTAFDFESLEFLKNLEMQIWKIPSGEITNLPYLIEIAKIDKDIILSTGMSTEKEIDDALNVLIVNGAKKITILHCTTEYPAPMEEVNLNVINWMKDKYDFSIGYSDHTDGYEVALAAVAMGAKVIEKHFTLDKNLEGPDHKASIEPKELKSMIEKIRNIEIALGVGYKCPTESEKKNRTIARKSIVAAQNIKKGDIFTENNITVKRPGNGISPMNWFDVLGKNAVKDFSVDDIIEL